MAVLADAATKKLKELSGQSRKRELKPTLREEGGIIEQGGRKLISFSCNDYLGLSHHPEVKKAAMDAIEKYGSGAGAARLVTGNHPLYEQLETKLAKWKGYEKALVFGSGYLTNIGVIPALVGKDDLIIADKLVHACLLDGAKLSDAKLFRFKHNDVKDCERLLAIFRGKYRHCLIITDEVFSMDGDLAPLAGLGKLAKKHDAWLMADGAHGLRKLSYPVDIYVGTLSKTLGAYGGYVCAQKEIIDYIANHARSFIYSTALPASTLASAIAALDIMAKNPALTAEPIENARIFTRSLGLHEAQSSIVPLILGEDKKAIAAAKSLENAGYLAVAIRPPTVPEGTTRLRFAFSALHKREDILEMAEFIKKQGWNIIKTS